MAVTIKGKTIKELREEATKLHADAQALHSEHGDDWTDDRDSQFNAMMDDRSTLIAAANRMAALASKPEATGEPLPNDHPMAGMPGHDGAEAVPMIEVRGYDASPGGAPKYHRVKAGKRGQDAHVSAFSRYLRHGASGLGPEQLAALQSDDADQAGYLTASEQFATELLKEVDDLVFIRQHARIHTVPQAESLGIRKRTANANTFDWSSELAISTEDSTLAYGKKVLTPHHLTGLIKVSRDLVRRSIMPVDMIVREELAINAGEKQEDAFLTGSGSQQPLGVFTASSDGISTSRDVVTGSSTSITADGLLNAKYSLKAQYRKGGRGAVRWLFHRDGIKIIAKLKDSDNQYLFRVGAGVQQDASDPSDMLLGYPVDESERSPNTFTTGLYVGLLANWRYYEIADALDMEMQVLTEKYADTNQIGYIGRMKTDGMPTLEEAFVRLITD